MKYSLSSKASRQSKLHWKDAGIAEEVLKEQLEGMYWDGVKQELQLIFINLRKFRAQNYEKHSQDRDTYSVIEPGFETFIGQVSHESRALADRHGEFIQEWKLKGKPHCTYWDAVFDKNREATEASERLKSEVVSSVATKATMNRLDGIEHLARLLLRSYGFLDIERLIGHRPVEPLKVIPGLPEVEILNYPVIPQMAFSGLTKDQKSTFEPWKCWTPNCGAIRGTMFEGGTPKRRICEECYRKISHSGPSSYVKLHKHCVFPEAIDAETSRRLCPCFDDVPHEDENGNPRSLFPVDATEKHDRTRPGNCGLLRLNENLAEAKFNTIHENRDQGIGGQLRGRARTTEDSGKDDDADWPHQTKLKPGTFLPEDSIGVADLEKEDESIPFLLRGRLKRYPFGNVHVALRMGPLTVENGVRSTGGGALIKLRESPRLLRMAEKETTRQRLITVTPTEPRKVFTAVGSAPGESATAPRRIKAVMKQVVGWPFATASNLAEEQFIQNLVRASQREDIDDVGLKREEQEEILGEVVDDLFRQLKDLLKERAELYLDDLATTLTLPQTDLRWNNKTNNCQAFCDKLINRGLFGSLVDQNASVDDSQKSPLYLMSFVCRPEAYANSSLRSKFDVPNGMTEEYLLKFHYGLHEDSDIFDSLQEYWHDWGAFGKPLYPFQDLFPWDCSEAFRDGSRPCSKCDITKHVWAFPFDSWSIIALHLTRSRDHYANMGDLDAKMEDPKSPLSDDEWLRNRMLLLEAEDALARVAVAMAKSRTFRESTRWLHEQDDARKDRLKLGGIHQAQPWSKSLVRGTLYRYFTAHWAHLHRNDQVAAYEKERNYRMKMLDIGVTPQGRARHPGGTSNTAKPLQSDYNPGLGHDTAAASTSSDEDGHDGHEDHRHGCGDGDENGYGNNSGDDSGHGVGHGIGNVSHAFAHGIGDVAHGTGHVAHEIGHEIGHGIGAIGHGIGHVADGIIGGMGGGDGDGGGGDGGGGDGGGGHGGGGDGGGGGGGCGGGGGGGGGG